MLLALDTATTTASLALYHMADQRLLAEYTWEARRRQTQDLLLSAQKLLAQFDVPPHELTALAVTTGPGSFTGVRIGISTVKGIGLGLPTRPQVIGVPTLAVTAAPWLELIQRTQPDSLLCAVIQAGRGRYNWVFFGSDALRGDVLCGDVLLWRPGVTDHQGGTLADLVEQLLDRDTFPIWLVGETDSVLREAIVPLSHVIGIDPISGWRRAGQLARLAALHLATGVEDDLATLQPLYLRNP